MTGNSRVLMLWTLAALLVAGPINPAFPAGTDVSNGEFWRRQFSELSREIRQNGEALGKMAVAVKRQVLDTNAMIFDTDRDPTGVVLRRTDALLERFSVTGSPGRTGGFASRLSALRKAYGARTGSLGKKTAVSEGEADTLYLAVQALNREIMLADPRLDFTDLIFVERGVLNDGVEYDGNHMCDQYFGHNGKTGGGLFILKNFATNPEKVNVMSGVRVPNGTNSGKLMTEGTFLSPELSYDGTTILFAWSSGGSEKWRPENRFNLFSINVDGTGIRRLTDGDYDDFDPCFLPSGRIVFISTRRGGYGRCHVRPVPTYTLFSMKSDGSDIICLSYHETNEWQPSVMSDGRLVYSRWDYVDRDLAAAHHIWVCNPDGTDPRSWHGNYALPFNTIEGNGPWSDGRALRPWAEYNARSIPGSDKIVATAGPHHGQSFGSLVIIDQNIPDDGKMSQVTRLTPDARFPESETANNAYRYGTPWPLSEDLYLCNNDASIILLDRSGSKQQLYRSSNLRPIDPIPLRERPVPSAVPPKTYQGERHTSSSPKATISIMDVYTTDSIGRLPEGAKAKQLRIMQVLAKSTPLTNQPLIGATGDYWGGGIARFPLGVVPVEEDGSVYFEAPVGKEIYFQLLDSNGCAIQSMRSGTYVHSGEQLTCVGCHENKWETPPAFSGRKALARAPSVIEPEIDDQYPFGFYRCVKPVFDNTCVGCHTSRGRGLQRMEYDNIVGSKTDGFNDPSVESRRYGFFFTSSQGCTMLMHQGSRTLPGRFGAIESRMGKALLNNREHQEARSNGSISENDFRTVLLWLDGNCDELGAFNNESEQRLGRRVWPDLDVDPSNPTGVEEGPVVTAENSVELNKTGTLRCAMRGSLLQLAGLPETDGRYEMAVFECGGRCIFSRSFDKSAPDHTFTLDAPEIARGLYIVRVHGHGQKTLSAKFCCW